MIQTALDLDPWSPCHMTHTISKESHYRMPDPDLMGTFLTILRVQRFGLVKQSQVFPRKNLSKIVVILTKFEHRFGKKFQIKVITK